MRKILQLEIDIQLCINDSLKSILTNNFFKDIPLGQDNLTKSVKLERIEK